MSEEQEQAAVIQWASFHPELEWLHHVPNGAYVHIKTARKLKKLGLKSGVADLFWPVPKGEHHGLYIEMKSSKGRQSPKQKAFEDHCSANGYKYIVCYSAEQAIEEIKKYMGEK